MIKIHEHEAGGQLILEVEGRLAGAFVPALEDCWRKARERQPQPDIAIDLRNVTCVDRAGRCLLQLLQSNGVPFLRAGLAIQDILEQLKEKSECNG